MIDVLLLYFILRQSHVISEFKKCLVACMLKHVVTFDQLEKSISVHKHQVINKQVKNLPTSYTTGKATQS